MLELLWLIPALPMAGFLFLAMFGRRVPRWVSTLTGTGSVGTAAVLSIVAAVVFVSGLPDQQVYTRTLWTWVHTGDLEVGISFYLDALALIMVLVITGVGFLIHLYSVGYMAQDEGYSRFFAYMNLFVAAMLLLVLADNLLLLYLGWEGVGVCSYLLIGFWYTDPANGRAARKAFVVTRVGDTAMAVGLFLLFRHLETLHIQELMHRAASAWTIGALLPTIAALLLVGGAVGKSAQLPLQTWLPDAMAGPTPVSALIHAATMVTAGVYLIARTHALFQLAPAAMTVVAVIGAATLLLAGFSALCQRDIKRVLAYSTISQIGYMFLALGVGAWTAAMFHFMTHAVFKALLFLSAGAIIHALDGQQDMFKMGGLRREMPLTYLFFLAGAAALAAVPIVSAGFYSKDMIIWETFAAPAGGPLLWAVAQAGALLTALYTFRMFFITFEGALGTPVAHKPGWAMSLPQLVLALLAIGAGFVEVPSTLGGVHLFSNFMHHALPPTPLLASRQGYELTSQALSVGLVVAGIAMIWWLTMRAPNVTAGLAQSAVGKALNRFWLNGWGFDRIYDLLVVEPYVFLARIDRDDIVDMLFVWFGRAGRAGYRLAAATQTGRLRTYAAALAFGAVAAIAIMVWL